MPVSSLGRVVAALGKLAFGVLEQLAPAVLGQGSEPGPEAALLVMFKVLKVGKNTDHRLLKNVLHRMRINPPTPKPGEEEPGIAVKKIGPGLGAITGIAHAFQQAQVCLGNAGFVQSPP